MLKCHGTKKTITRSEIEEDLESVERQPGAEEDDGDEGDQDAHLPAPENWSKGALQFVE